MECDTNSAYTFRGKLVLMVPEMSDAPYQRGIGINEWIQNSQGQYQSPSLVRFTQRDIDEGYLWYNDQPSSDDEDEPLVEAFAYEVVLNSLFCFYLKLISFDIDKFKPI